MRYALYEKALWKETNPLCWILQEEHLNLKKISLKRDEKVVDIPSEAKQLKKLKQEQLDYIHDKHLKLNLINDTP